MLLTPHPQARSTQILALREICAAIYFRLYQETCKQANEERCRAPTPHHDLVTDLPTDLYLTHLHTYITIDGEDQYKKEKRSVDKVL